MIYLYHLVRNQRICYVGLTKNPTNRKSDHKNRFPPHEFQLIEEFSDASLASSAERIHIAVYNTYKDFAKWNRDPGGNYAESSGYNRKGIGGNTKRTKHALVKRKIKSERMKGIPVHPKLTTLGLKKPHSEQTKQKIKIAAQNREQMHCAQCGKNISGKMNWDRHIHSRKHLSQILITAPAV